MKQCTICKEQKSLDDFNNKKTTKDGKQSHCRECAHIRFKMYYRKNYDKHRKITAATNKQSKEKIQRWLNQIRSVGCSLCSENDPCCIDFHHLDKTTKIDGVARLAGDMSFPKLVAEINKCVLLCANCHRKLHNGKDTVDETMLCKVTLPPKDKTGYVV